MCYVHNQCYDISCATLYIYIYIFIISLFILHLKTLSLIPETARSKTWVCGRSLVGIVGSNSAGGIDVFLV